ncbi:MAG TPA: hypothetical protein VK158_01790 [Acidobacteriota bacterium]|nr:hypothetical protein [Acidobacteriota bacterium]
MSYFLLHKHDPDCKDHSKNPHRWDVYDKMSMHRDFPAAQKAYFGKLAENPILAKVLDGPPSELGPYVIAAYYPKKYGSYDYLGDLNYHIPSHEVARCSKDDLKSVLERMVKDKPSKIFVGIEQKVM